MENEQTNALVKAIKYLADAIRYNADVVGHAADKSNVGGVEITGGTLPDVNVDKVEKFTDQVADSLKPPADSLKPPADDRPPIELEGLRSTVNSYAKKAGKKIALALISKYAPSLKLEDIATDKYNDIVDTIDQYTGGNDAA